MSSNRMDIFNKVLTELFKETLGYAQATKNLQQHVSDATAFQKIIKIIEDDVDGSYFDPYYAELANLRLLRVIQQTWVNLEKAKSDDECIRLILALRNEFKYDTYYACEDKINGYIQQIASCLTPSPSVRNAYERIIPPPAAKPNFAGNAAVLFFIPAGQNTDQNTLREMQLMAEVEYYKNRVNELERGKGPGWT